MHLCHFIWWLGDTRDKQPYKEGLIVLLLPPQSCKMELEGTTVPFGTPSEKDTIEIGIIGMGDMGRLYARRIHAAGWKQLISRALKTYRIYDSVNVCDLPSKYESLKAELQGWLSRVS
ncbi:hypothetical protein BC936DRAFT_146229 [Jimgerdemannia flammicorona]|uniref:Uncharacterized protein n=1 Tax=Jimgerdemannia flammicorona TaxID=994334 RepID=A0A433D824_9FUNG|nr:hypothetical protein BC936DRAFT_146229 [Jimgerdemannia flammicorona]